MRTKHAQDKTRQGNTQHEDKTKRRQDNNDNKRLKYKCCTAGFSRKVFTHVIANVLLPLTRPEATGLHGKSLIENNVAIDRIRRILCL
jgi:hypothetical protein